MARWVIGGRDCFGMDRTLRLLVFMVTMYPTWDTLRDMTNTTDTAAANQYPQHHMQTLGRIATAATLKAVGLCALAAAGVLYLLDVGVTTETVANLGIFYALAGLALWLPPRVNNATDEQLHRWGLVVFAALLAVCIYAALAAYGITPAAPWSPLG